MILFAKLKRVLFPMYVKMEASSIKMVNWRSRINAKDNADNKETLSFSKMIKETKLAVYFLVISILIAILLSVMVMACIRYGKWPTYTEVSFISQSEAKFPAVTICPLSNGYKEAVLQVSDIV